MVLLQKLELQDDEEEEDRFDQQMHVKPKKQNKPTAKSISQNDLCQQSDWIIQDNLDIQNILAKRENAQGKIGQNQLMDFMKKDLNCDANPNTVRDYIIYINGNKDDKFITSKALIDTMKRLNPKFGDFLRNRSRQKVSNFTIEDYQSTQAGPRPKDVGNQYSEQAFRLIYERLINFLQNKNYSFSHFTQSQTTGMIKRTRLKNWIRRIKFQASDDQIQCLEASMDDYKNPNQLRLCELKRRIFQIHPDFFSNRQINTESDAKIKMQTWPQEYTQLLVKFAQHILSKKWSFVDAIQKMILRVARDEMVEGLVDMEVFVKGMNSLDFNVGDDTLRQSLFSKMDTKENLVITDDVLLNFLNACRSYSKNQGQNRQIDFREEIRQELKKVFDIARNENPNDQINADQLKRAFEAIGIFKKDRQISDMLGPSKMISEAQFYQIMEPQIMKSLEDEERSYQRMRQFFIQADKDNNHQLSQQEFASVLKNKFQVDMSAQEIGQFLGEIDINTDGLIDIDQFIAFMQTAGIDQNLSEKGKNALLHIRQSCAFNPHSYVRTFLQTPQNFIKSFFAQQYNNCRIYPASVFKPQMDSSTMTYTDLLINKALRDDGIGVKITSKKAYNDIYTGTKLRPLQTNIGSVISLSSAVKVPNFKKIQELQKIIKCVVKIGILEGNHFVGNTTFVPATWNPKYRYQWKFNSSDEGSLNPFIFRSIQKQDREREIIFEFVIYHKTGNDVVEMSCGFSRLPISQLLTNKKIGLKIEGGSPLNIKDIAKKDTVSRISFWNRNKTSKLWVYCKAYKSLNQDQRLHIDYLPNNCLLPLRLLHFGSAYRHYLADVILQQDTFHDLYQADGVIKNFLRMLNCPDIVENFTRYWQQLVISKLSAKEQMPGPELINRMKDMVERIYVVIYKNEFNYKDANPTDSGYLISNDLFKKRGDLIYSAMTQNNALANKRSNRIKRDLKNETEFKPFTIDELAFDPYDGIGMQKLLDEQWKDKRNDLQHTGMLKSRGQASFKENYNNNTNENSLPNAPSSIIDNIYGNLMQNVNRPKSEEKSQAPIAERLQVPQ